MSHGKVTHSSHTGSSYCGSDVLKGGPQVVFFMALSMVQRKKKEEEADQWQCGQTTCPCLSAHMPVQIVHSLTAGFTSGLQQQG